MIRPRPSRRTRRYLSLVAAVAVMLIGAAPLGGAAIAATPTVPATANPVVTPPGGFPGQVDPNAPKQTTATVSRGAGKPGTTIIVQGSGWPANITIQASTCGNLAINGATDCDEIRAGSTVSDKAGAFVLQTTIGNPPKPCPCVIHVVSPQTTQQVDQQIVVIGHPVGPLDRSTSTRTATASLKLDGAGPITAWLGGKAKRTVVLTVSNTGTVTLANPTVTLTVGKGSDPTALLGRPQIGTIPPGATIVYRLPITIKAPAFGEYSVRAIFGDLDKPLSVKGSTSSYPWILIVLGWLLLQIPLLGLYRRREVIEDAGGDYDPFGPRLPTLGGPVPTAAMLGGEMPNGALVGAGAAVAAAGVMDHGGYAPAGHYGVVPQPGRALLPSYAPVFGVTDLRAYLTPGATHRPATPAPRIVIGGIIPAAPAPPPPPAPDALPPPYDPSAQNGTG